MKQKKSHCELAKQSGSKKKYPKKSKSDYFIINWIASQARNDGLKVISFITI